MDGTSRSERWSLLAAEPLKTQALAEALSIDPLVARVLVARGMSDADAAARFLSPSLERDWEDPYAIPNLDKVAARIEQAIAAGEKIAIFGDFDVDGMSSSALLYRALKDLNAQVKPFIPNRFGEGYGLSLEALGRVIEDFAPSLIVTVDNGIAARTEVAWLLEQGIDVCVTDHHEPADAVPERIPVADPKLEADNVSRDLAGAGVALKLVQILGEHLGAPELWQNYIDLATLGTLSDMMPLVGENRALVAVGIERLKHTHRAGIIALAEVARVSLPDISADSLPFSLIPRLNAAGRMGSTELAFKLLITDDPAEAMQLAGALEAVNNERREIEAELTQEALSKVEATYAGEKCVVVAGNGWHEGVKGIVASRIVNHYHVPAILFTISDGIARGSGRSVGSVDLFHALEQCADFCIRFGGHAGAVGVTCDVEQLDAFKARLTEVLSALPDEQFIATEELTAEVGLSELTVSSIDALERLQPFGQANKKPLFLIPNVSMHARSRVGNTGAHLRFIATDGIDTIPAIMFRAPHIDELAAYDGIVDVVAEPVNETWQGRVKAKLMVKDILMKGARPAESELLAQLRHVGDQLMTSIDLNPLAHSRSFLTTISVTKGVAERIVPGQELKLDATFEQGSAQVSYLIKTEAGEAVGTLREQIAQVLAPLSQRGIHYSVHTVSTFSLLDRASYYVRLRLTRMSTTRAQMNLEAASKRDELAALADDELLRELTRAYIGEHELLPAQARAVHQLINHESTLAVMATGRGKSLIFQLAAAYMAIREGKASVFVYPLRALVSDQAFHLKEALARFGMNVAVLTGESQEDERNRTYTDLSEGRIDIILTTPEYLAIHADKLAGAVGLLVIDEAHHAGRSKSGMRASYQKLPEIRAALNNPVVAALSATITQEMAEEICRLCGIDDTHVIKDSTERSNLHLHDLRNHHDRDTFIASVVAKGEKSIIYVGTREQTVTCARMLRHQLPHLANQIAFYNAGLTRGDRLRVEQAFREGELSCIVSTSAFGEGVNISDIRHVILYSMPFGAVEFNQMSGRAGRDGRDAHIYLLFGTRDARANDRMLAASAPAREDLMCMYATLSYLAKQYGQIALSNAEIAEAARERFGAHNIDEHMVSCALAVFKELNFLDVEGFGSARQITMNSQPKKSELTDSIRYLEALDARELFEDFSSYIMSAMESELASGIQRPITPDFGTEVSEV